MNTADEKNFGQNADLSVPIEQCKKCKRGYMVQIGEIPKKKINFPVTFIDGNKKKVNLTNIKPSKKKQKIVESCCKIYFQCNLCGKRGNKRKERKNERN